MKNVEENNKLIAEFMGIKPISKDVYMYPDQRIEGGGIISNNRHISDIHYHDDWNWLMEVVEKIEDIQDGEEGDCCRSHLYDISIRQHVVIIEDTNIDVAEYGSKLLNTYYAVVEFIRWYNKNK